MFCPSCGTSVQQGQKFCTECGHALPAVAPPAAAPPSGSLPPPSFAPPPAADPDATAAFTVVEQTSPGAVAWDPDATAAWPAQEPVTPASTPTTPAFTPAAGPSTAENPVVGAQQFRITPLVAVSALAGVLAVAAALVDVASYEVTGAFSIDSAYKLNDFSTANLVGTIIAAVLLIGGAVLGAIGKRVGTGLAGGAGLALGGLVSMVAGSVIGLFDGTEVGLIQAGGEYTLTTTYEIGFFLAVAAAALGAVAFALSLREMGYDGRPVTPAIGVLGALGTLAAAVGPLIPVNGASFGDNFSQDVVPPATLYLRLLVLVLILVGGLLGFLVNRRWGLGLALGAISVGVWQWITSITESGDIPAGIAGGNFFADDLKPHLVTTIGVVVMVIAAIAGLLSAAQQGRSAT